MSGDPAAMPAEGGFLRGARPWDSICGGPGWSKLTSVPPYGPGRGTLSGNAALARGFWRVKLPRDAITCDPGHGKLLRAPP